ncbi:LuxR C-terminal-related transcriptional regulator [Actinotalea sp. M2MS4P-6]|uniref:helix-turn-helix transcriptional regulator n=1 Tax=Actinotalea sp. M2MS4P-6 TaxID=2983762 RepID=UPI0021E4B416|nr:LuxR family transcriptional regulator [Actinotalea sp. M2MS4P-6]MCV2395208.1 LuxR C-terminal-related transcriptional regulator [Actinotalea sp. M2MS4P-6]
MTDLAPRPPATMRATSATHERPPTRQWPTLDRPGARAAVTAALQTARSVLVVGGAGVGKTHLVGSVLAALPAGLRVVSPYLDEVRAAGPGAALELYDPRPTDAAPEPAGAAAPAGPCDGADAPPLLHIDSAHLLDHAVATALAVLVRRGEAQVVATLRPEGAQESPWLELWRDGFADRVDLRPLDAPQTAELVAAALGGPLTGDTSRRIWQRTQGNPRYLRELIRHEVDSGTLAPHDGVWVGPADADPSPALLDAVVHDLGRLGGALRDALELVALAGPVPVSVLDGVVDDTALDELVRRGVVTIGRSGPGGGSGTHASLDQPLAPVATLEPPAYAEAVRALVPLARRRRLFAMLRAERPGFPAPHLSAAGLVRSVLWALECDIHQTGERLLRAARAATTLRRPEVTVQITSAALRQNLGAVGLRADALLLRAQAWWLVGEPGRAAADLLEVAGRLAADDTGPEHRMRQIRFARQTADLYQYRGDELDETFALIDAFLGDLDDDPELRTALQACRLTRLGTAGRFAESVGPSVELLTSAGHRSSEVLQLAAPTIVGLAGAGRLDDAVELGIRSLRAAEVHEGRYPWVVADIRSTVVLAQLWSGEVEAAEDSASLLGHADRASTRQYGADDIAQGLLAAARGRWSDAFQAQHVAGVGLRLVDPYGIAAYARAAQAVAAAALGDTVEAHRLIEASQLAPSRASSMIEPELRLQVLDARLWLSDPSLRAEALGLAHWSAERGLHRIELEALHRMLVGGYLAGAADPTDRAVLARVRDLARVVQGPRAAALAAHADALVEHDVELASVGAQTLCELGLWLPSVAVATRLTPREREIAGLAAGGLSSRAIAERLTVSVRTVDSHLSRVFAKLGVRSRRELRGVRDL